MEGIRELGVWFEQLNSRTHEKKQGLRKLGVMNGGGSHDLITLRVDFPLTRETVGIWTQSGLARTYKRCGVAISRSPAFRND